MTKRIVFAIASMILVVVAGPVGARVTGLPDFTGLVEEAVPAVVNIRVIKKHCPQFIFFILVITNTHDITFTLFRFHKICAG